MKLNKLMGVGLLALAPTVSMAQGIGNSVDVYYLSSSFEIDLGGGFSFKDDGDGFGVKGKFAFADNLFFSGEYQTAEYDDTDLKLDQLRLGVGYNAKLSEQTQGYILGEYVRLKDDAFGASSSENGFGLHMGVQFDATSAFGIKASIGYVDIGDFGSGVELLAGVHYDFTDTVGLSADYRFTRLAESGEDVDVGDLRLGVRFSF